jgi:DnaJ-domain-containing protein 1
MSTYAQSTQRHRCDECGHEMAMPLFCDGCGVDYPERRRMSPFGVLGLTQTFDLADDDLDRIETLLAQRLHPDRWQARGDRLHRKALLAQAAANEALAAVRDPWARGDTLLGLQSEIDDLPRTQLPTAFLVEQLELQEEVDDELAPARKRELTREVRAALKALRDDLAEAFAVLEVGEDRIAAMSRARELVDRSRYWRNVQAALRGRSAPH